MKKTLLIILVIKCSVCSSQINWSNYSTSFNGKFGIAIPYNGAYDNFTGETVGIAHWNPQYHINIDKSIADSTPLYFVYDTGSVYFLTPLINSNNANNYEFAILRNNSDVIVPWSKMSLFTTEEIGGILKGSGIAGPYRAKMGDYIVAKFKDETGNLIKSIVVLWKKQIPEVKSILTSSNALTFSKIVASKDVFDDHLNVVGWHKQYLYEGLDSAAILHLDYNENNILVNVDANIYKKEALQYCLEKDGEKIKFWHDNEFDNNHILLKDLSPGNYILIIRLTRQPDSIKKVHFSISTVWYNTAIFKIASFIFIALLAGLIYLLIKHHKQSKSLKLTAKKYEKVSGELQNIHSLLNPHFIYNALNSIQYLVNKNDIESANKYLSNFGGLLRETLTESQTQLIPLSKELQNIATYISLEKLRNHFEYNMMLENVVNIDTVQIPPFILQPFIENAIKHAFLNKHDKKILNLRISIQNEDLSIVIEDNGAGFNVSSYKKGFGLGLSKKRIALLNAELGEDYIKLNIESNRSGTKIILYFKNWFS